MVEGARLESVYTATYRGFESLLLRQNQNQNQGLLGPFFGFDGAGGVDEPSGSTTSAHGRVWTRSPWVERPVRVRAPLESILLSVNLKSAPQGSVSSVIDASFGKLPVST